ncbi:hypothetical protein HN446_00795 [bacterium]|jgi:hypothetical protein|nr:hypothetical protein [bacterium]
MKKYILLATLSTLFVSHINATPMNFSLIRRDFDDSVESLQVARDVMVPAIIDGTFFKAAHSGVSGFCRVTKQNIIWLLDALRIWRRSNEGRIRDIDYYIEKAAKEVSDAQTEYGALIKLISTNETQNEVGLKKAIRKVILQKHGHSLYPHYEFISLLRKYTWYSNKHNTYAQKLTGLLQKQNGQLIFYEKLKVQAVLIEIIGQETSKIQELIDTALELFSETYQDEMRQREMLHVQQRSARATESMAWRY